MGNNRRKVYGEGGAAAGGEACPKCGCRHSYAMRAPGGAAERVCRNCGRRFPAPPPSP